MHFNQEQDGCQGMKIETEDNSTPSSIPLTDRYKFLEVGRGLGAGYLHIDLQA